MENEESSKYSACAVESTPNSGMEPELQGIRKRRITIEPVILLLSFAINLTSAVYTNLILVRSCEFLGYPKENCTDMNTHSGSSVELRVQPLVAQLAMYKTLIESFLPALMSFFLGPWGDAHGRKPLILLCISGYCFYFLSLIVFTVSGLSPYYVLLASIPLVASGGFITYISMCFSYISDISDSSNRTIRIAIAESVLFLGLILSTTASSYVYAVFPAHGYEGIFSISLGCSILAAVYTIYILPESISVLESRNSGFLRSLLDFNLVKGTFQTCCQSRPGYSRAILFLLVTVGSMNVITFEGNAAVYFLFTREKFHWTLRDFTLYIDAALLFTVLGVMVGTAVLSSWLKIPLAPLASAAFLIRGGAYTLAALSVKSWYLYLSSAIASVGGVTGPIGKSLICNTVSKTDIGKVFALSASVEAFMPLIASPLYTLLYNATASTFSGAFLMLTAALSASCSVLFGVVALLLRRNCSPEFTALEEESVTQDEVVHVSNHLS